MEEKKDFGEKLEAFFAGKGFYIVLLLSAAVIATSVWLMVAGSRADVDSTGTESNITQAAAARQPEGAIAAMNETELPSPTGAPTPVPEKPVVNDAPKLGETGETGAVQPEESAETMEPLTFLWPLQGSVERGYSVEALLYDRTMADWRTHDGWDIAAELGTAVTAAANGTVQKIYTDDLYGTVVVLDHGGALCSVYANLSPETAVVMGQSVTAGETLGTVGDTALGEIAEVSHLHFGFLLNGASADPANWLPLN